VVDSTGNIRPPDKGGYLLIALLGLAALGAATGGAFIAGTRFERQAAAPSIESLHRIEQERDDLSGQVAELKQQSIVLERSQQIDREACRNLSEELKDVQANRLAAEKEVSYLRRLIREGGGGILQATDLELKETGDPGEFGYSFTVRQLIQDFGESAGDIEIRLLGKREGEETDLSLAELDRADPKKHQMKLKHFQSFAGSFRVPDGFEPENLVVEIKPKTAKLIPASETFPWRPILDQNPRKMQN
jgi:hypothetical protein